LYGDITSYTVGLLPDEAIEEMIPIKIINAEATRPTRAHPDDAGLDLHCCEDIVLPGVVTVMGEMQQNLLSLFEVVAAAPRSGENYKALTQSRYKTVDPCRRTINTGVCLAIPDGYTGLIWDKSSLGSSGIKVAGGVIDAGYRGEIKVTLINLGETTVIKKGKAIAQLIIQPIMTDGLVEVNALDVTQRGSGGFGSTGR
jgi:dUTP pyrophosphatase